jgi:selT/selW/selH-like putative selenoprotein
MIPSSGGVFEIVVNGQNIYSKKATGEFPDHDLIIGELEKFKD